MALGRAGCRMPQTVAHGLEAFDHGIEFIGLGRQQLPVNAGLAAGQKHGTDVVQREPGRLPQCNQRQLVKHVGVPTLNFAFIGRWVGHLFRGQFAHAAIAKAVPIRGELAWGWLTHYALAVGVCAVAAPLLVMQPAMGSGFAASRTPTPLKNCLRSLANHTVFGFGLYLSALAIALISR